MLVALLCGYWKGIGGLLSVDLVQTTQMSIADPAVDVSPHYRQQHQSTCASSVVLFQNVVECKTDQFCHSNQQGAGNKKNCQNWEFHGIKDLSNRLISIFAWYV
jgi:hypothetical protein